jgi:hypothetical protein
MHAGTSIGRSGEALMKGFETAGAYLLRCAQADLDLVEACCLALLREGPAEQA